MKQNVKFYLNPKNFFTIAAAVCMILAAACRCIGIIPQIQVLSKNEMVELLALPVAACLLYAASVAFCGEKNVWLSIIPVIFGVMFFILRLFTNENISGQPLGRMSILLKLLLYITVTVIYTATVTGSLRTKYIQTAVIFLLFACHAGMEVYPAIKLLGDSLTWSSVLLEAGILFIMLGLLFASLGLKKAVPADPDAGRKIAPPIPGGSLKVSDPEPEEKQEEKQEQKQEQEQEAPAEPEPIPVFIDEPEEEVFTEPEPEAPEKTAEENPDAEPEREAAVPADRLSFAERIGLVKKHFIASADADDDMTDDFAEAAEEEALNEEDAEAADTPLEDD